jgi:hypothetical protein
MPPILSQAAGSRSATSSLPPPNRAHQGLFTYLYTCHLSIFGASSIDLRNKLTAWLIKGITLTSFLNFNPPQHQHDKAPDLL